MSISKWLWIGLAIASLPLMIFHSISLWNETYSWLFWSTYLVIAFVFWKEYWSGEPISVWRFRFGWIILVASCLAGILANSIGSSYLGQVAAIGALGAFLFVAGGSLHFVRVLVLVGLLGLLVIPEGYGNRWPSLPTTGLSMGQQGLSTISPFPMCEPIGRSSSRKSSSTLGFWAGLPNRSFQ